MTDTPSSRGAVLKGFIGGAICTLVILAGGAWGAAKTGMIPGNADTKPGALESRFAHTALDAWLKKNTLAQENPVALNDANLLEGMKLYKSNCMGCHGDKNGESAFGRAFYPPTPQFTKGRSPDDPDAIFHTLVVHGVRLTGMPAFGGLLKDDEIWKTILFVKNLSTLPPAVQAEWKKADPEPAK
jgi:mono/diheme cytochrome c family protein